MPRALSKSGWGALLQSLLFGVLLVLSLKQALAEPRGDVPAEDLILEVRTEKNRFYLHEEIPLTVTLLTGAVSVRNIQYPRLDSGAFSTTGFAPPRRINASRNNKEYTAYEFSTTLRPRASGKLDLGPAELQCDLLAPASAAASFFGGGEPRAIALRSEPLSLTILPLPRQGRPAGFTGAVGRFTVTRTATPMEVEESNPITVTTRIEGVGTLDALTCDPLLLTWARSYPPQVRRTRTRLICEQVLLPDMASRVELPAAVIHFFDPLTERYSSARSRSIPIKLKGSNSIKPGGVPSVATTSPAPRPSGTPEPSNWPYLAVAAGVLAVLASAVYLVISRRRTASARTAEVAEMLRTYLDEADSALKDDDCRRFHEAAFRLAQISAAKRCNLPQAGMTADSLDRACRRGAVCEPFSTLLMDVFQECDAVRYGQLVRDRQHLLQTFKKLKAIADLA